MAGVFALSNIAPVAAAGFIMAIGSMYLFTPHQATESFGLPLPEKGPNTHWWLRLKGVRDLVTGLVVLAVWQYGNSPRLTGIILGIDSLIALGDGSLVLASGGRAATAFGVHGAAAASLIAAAIPLIKQGP
jgi:hypothetical protein